MKRVLLAMALLAVACGDPGEEVVEPTSGSVTSGGEYADNTNAPPPRYEAPPPEERQPQRSGRAGSGRSAEDPVAACGPQDSYTFVAGEFQCPGGGNPLGGDPRAGARSRVGNVGANSTGHIIDLYRVPCPSGPVDVYVDMYGCPQMRTLLGE